MWNFNSKNKDDASGQSDEHSPTQGNAETIAQRDRFLAFAFASADLFIEVDENDTIIFALGASKTLTGVDHATLKSKNWLSVFDPSDHDTIKSLRQNASEGARCGPVIVALNQNVANRKGILTALKMPDSQSFFITLALSSPVMEQLAALQNEDEALTTGFTAEDEKKTALDTGYIAEDTKEDEPLETDFTAYSNEESVFTTGFTASDDDGNDEALTTDFTLHDLDKDETLTTGFDASKNEPDVLTTGFTAGDEEQNAHTVIDKQDFLEEAEDAFSIAQTHGADTAVTVFDFGRTNTMGDDDWADITNKISEILRAESLSGNATIEIHGGKYTLLHNEKTDIQNIEERLAEITNGTDIQSITMASNLDELSTEAAARALYYTINALDKNGMGFEVSGLASSMKKLVTANKEKTKRLKSIIERVDFEAQFQPIVSLATKEAYAYETLSRIGNDDIQDWIMFAEDVGLIADFDLAVVERSLNYVHYKAGTTRRKFSINLSPKSMEAQDFLERLIEQLDKRDLAHRIIFEITNAGAVKNVYAMSSCIDVLKQKGYEIALDDMNFTQGNIKRIQEIEPHYVKIDGKHIRRTQSSSKDANALQSFVSTCKSINVRVIAESIEDLEHADQLHALGIELGQGHAYGKAQTRPNYVPKPS